MMGMWFFSVSLGLTIAGLIAAILSGGSEDALAAKLAYFCCNSYYRVLDVNLLAWGPTITQTTKNFPQIMGTIH